MKILQINSVCGTGSTGRITTDLASILKAQGHECKIAYGRNTAPERYQNISVRIGNNFDIYLHGIATRLFDAHGFASNRATAIFWDWVRDYDPDLIHLHNIHGYYLNVKLLFEYLKTAGKPIVWTLHDCWSFTGHCTHYTIANCSKWKTICSRNCPQHNEYPKCLGRGNASRNFQRKQFAFLSVPNLTLVTPSHWLAKEVQQSFLQEYPIRVIPNGIDLEQFKPSPGDFRQRYGIENKRLLLGVANGWSSRKGLHDFLELAKQLSQDTKIVLVGLTPQQINNLPSNVLGIERTNSIQELAEIYTAADVFINPSKEETQGLTTVEALACGTPVITYNQTAVPEVADSTCGIAVTPGIQNLLDALSQISFPHDACRKRAKYFDKRMRFLEYLNLYEQLWAGNVNIDRIYSKTQVSELKEENAMAYVNNLAISQPEVTRPAPPRLVINGKSSLFNSYNWNSHSLSKIYISTNTNETDNHHLFKNGRIINIMLHFNFAYKSSDKRGVSI